MRLEIRSPRGETPSLDPAVVAAVAAAVTVFVDAGIVEETPASSPWRAAGRSVEAFDAYDAARHDRALRRGGAR